MVLRKRQSNVPGGRPVHHRVTVTVDQELALKVAASRAGMSIPRLLVESALTVDSRETLTERRAALAELVQLRRHVSAIGNNINQIARLVNSTGEIGRELGHELAGLHATSSRIDDLLERLAITVDA